MHHRNKPNYRITIFCVLKVTDWPLAVAFTITPVHFLYLFRQLSNFHLMNDDNSLVHQFGIDITIY